MNGVVGLFNTVNKEKRRKIVRNSLIGLFSVMLLMNIGRVNCDDGVGVLETLPQFVERSCPKTVVMNTMTRTEYSAKRLPELSKAVVVDTEGTELLEDIEYSLDDTYSDVSFPETVENPYVSELLGIIDAEEEIPLEAQVNALDSIQVENQLLMVELEDSKQIYKGDSIEGVKLQYIGDTLELSSALAYEISENIKNGIVVEESDVDSLVELEQSKAEWYKTGELSVLDKSTDAYSRVKESADTSINIELDLVSDWKDISDEKRDRMNSLCTGIPMYSTSELVNEMVANVINTYCTDDMTPADKAYTCYKYIMANTKYAKYNYSKALYNAIGVGGDGEWVDKNGVVQWSKRRPQTYAVARVYSMLSDSINRGACDNYSVATVACFRALGFDARVVAKNEVHFWVEVVDPNTGDSYVFDNELQGKGQNIEHTNKDAAYNEFFCSTYDEAKTYWKVYTQGSMAQGMSYASCSDYNSIFNIDSPIYEGTYAYNVALGLFE